MKKCIYAIAALCVSYTAFAGGSIGGGSGGLQKGELALELAEAAFDVQSLPKVYMEASDFRRATARLGVDGIESVNATIDGESLDLRRFRDAVVDAKFSKEILPSE